MAGPQSSTAHAPLANPAPAPASATAAQSAGSRGFLTPLAAILSSVFCAFLNHDKRSLLSKTKSGPPPVPFPDTASCCSASFCCCICNILTFFRAVIASVLFEYVLLSTGSAIGPVPVCTSCTCLLSAKVSGLSSSSAPFLFSVDSLAGVEAVPRLSPSPPSYGADMNALAAATPAGDNATPPAAANAAMTPFMAKADIDGPGFGPWKDTPLFGRPG